MEGIKKMAIKLSDYKEIKNCNGFKSLTVGNGALTVDATIFNPFTGDPIEVSEPIKIAQVQDYEQKLIAQESEIMAQLSALRSELEIAQEVLADYAEKLAEKRGKKEPDEIQGDK